MKLLNAFFVTAAMLAALVLSALSLTPCHAGAETAPPAPAIIAMGAYVPTNDIEGSQAFYRILFDRAPVIALPDFTAFDIEGGWFAVVSREKYAPDAAPGTGAVPYLQSANLEALRARVAAAGFTAPEIIKEPGIAILKIPDPNGQLIEFFSLTGT